MLSKKSYRVALMGIYHESNTFIDRKTTITDFENSHLLRGEQVMEEYKDAHHEIGGMLAVMEEHGVGVIPVLFAEATPGGRVTASAYGILVDELAERLKAILPVDGCLVVPHGAGVAENQPDMDGHWLGRVRELVGADVPIIGTLDPHANVSSAMITATDALVAYKTNPHIDQYETGRAAGELLIQTLKGIYKPVQYLVKPPVTISIEQQQTAHYPCKMLYEAANAVVRPGEVLSISILLGFPYADVPEMGTSFLVVTNNDRYAGEEVAHQLAAVLTANRHAFVGVLETLEIQRVKIASAPKPVLWLDMGDNVGGGAAGDSVVLLKQLEQQPGLRGFTCVYDPDSVAVGWRVGVGDCIQLALGNDYQLGLRNQPYHVEATVLAKVDGKFEEHAPRHGGQVRFNMGDTLLVETRAGNVIMIHALRVPPFSLSQLTTFGIDPAAFDVLIAKGVNAPIAAYGPICKTVLQANTPGATQADMTGLDFRFRRRPLFPFDHIMS
ncbi:M81 family metallopeptidase [Parapedobacter pyrenivorans]|uniref:M81 family metallopeptidase n=1 Tax=Parapedobacter pyrenivorans TaxID=1305674 RepID=UPI003342ABD3